MIKKSRRIRFQQEEINPAGFLIFRILCLSRYSKSVTLNCFTEYQKEYVFFLIQLNYAVCVLVPIRWKITTTTKSTIPMISVTVPGIRSVKPPAILRIRISGFIGLIK